MPQVPFKAITQFTENTVAEAPEPRSPGFVETMGAAFEMENDVLNAVEYMMRPAYEPDETWRGARQTEWLKKSGMWAVS